MTEQTKEQVQENAPETAQAPDNDLTINDLSSMKQIIDIASSRGAFKANEMEAVGKVYNKLSNFLAQVAAKGQQKND
jgi:cell division protein FtsL